MSDTAGSCVYCDQRQATTRDHVIPKSLFLPPRSGNLITVPCCTHCNSEKQTYDDLLRDMLAIVDFTNRHPASLGLYTGPARRAIDNNRSRLARLIKQEADFLEIRSPDGELLDWRYTLQIDPGDISAFFVFVVKGLTFYEYGVKLPDNAIVEVAHLLVEPFRLILREMAQTGRVKGPTRLGGAICVFASLFRDEYHAAWAISFFQDRWFSVSVSHLDEGWECSYAS